MPEHVTKDLKVTFKNARPMGIHATFNHDGEIWIAHSGKRDQKIWALIDRLVGIHAATTRDMVSWINARPGDAELVMKVLERTERARNLHAQLVSEKMEAGME